MQSMNAECCRLMSKVSVGRIACVGVGSTTLGCEHQRGQPWREQHRLLGSASPCSLHACKTSPKCLPSMGQQLGSKTGQSYTAHLPAYQLAPRRIASRDFVLINTTSSLR